MTPEPYYRDDAVTIYHGHCEDVLPALVDDPVDIIVTSPPYNMGLSPGGGGTLAGSSGGMACTFLVPPILKAKMRP